MKKVFTTSTTKHITADEKAVVKIKEFKIFGFTYWTKTLKKEAVNKLSKATN